MVKSCCTLFNSVVEIFIYKHMAEVLSCHDSSSFASVSKAEYCSFSNNCLNETDMWLVFSIDHNIKTMPPQLVVLNKYSTTCLNHRCITIVIYAVEDAFNYRCKVEVVSCIYLVVLQMSEWTNTEVSPITVGPKLIFDLYSI